MKKIHELTPEQQEFAGRHHNLVYKFLWRSHLDEEEFYDIVIFGYLEAVQDYLEKPELLRFKFSTVAWIKMRCCVISEYIYQNRPKRNAPMGTYHEEFDTAVLNQFLPNRMTAIAETLDNQTLAIRLLSHLTPKEKTVVQLKAEGYTYKEIAEQCNITTHGVDNRFYRMRKRLRKLSLI